ncbi:MAG: PilW family protein [Nitrospiria bacterium]
MALFGKRSNQHGFTVLEFLIATTVFVTVMAAGSDFFNSMNRSSVVNSELTDMQQDVRAAMLTLVRDISMSGYGTSSFGACNNPITPTNSSSGPDAISVVSMSTAATTLAAAAAPGASSLTLAPPAVVGTISLNGIRTTTAVLSAGTTVNINPPLDISGETYPVGTQVLTPSCIQYSVNPVTRDLTRTVGGVGSILASGVIDMQFAYALDANGDGRIDDANASGSFDAGDFVNLPLNLDTIRLVRVSLYLQTIQPDRNYGNGAPITLEDHNPTTDPGYTLAAYQPFRSRILTRIVRPRNIGLP